MYDNFLNSNNLTKQLRLNRLGSRLRNHSGRLAITNIRLFILSIKLPIIQPLVAELQSSRTTVLTFKPVSHNQGSFNKAQLQIFNHCEQPSLLFFERLNSCCCSIRQSFALARNSLILWTPSPSRTSATAFEPKDNQRQRSSRTPSTAFRRSNFFKELSRITGITFGITPAPQSCHTFFQGLREQLPITFLRFVSELNEIYKTSSTTP